MELLRCKARIAVLWVIIAVSMAAHFSFAVMASGGLDEIVSEMETAGAGIWIFKVCFWLVPLWLAFLSVTIKGSANRWVNFVLGIIFVIGNIHHFVEHMAEPTVQQILILGSAVVASALVAWFAWKLPEQES